MSAKTYRTVPVRDLSSDELLELSKQQKLSLSREDMEVVQQIFREVDRDPTDVELEVIAQTWSEHCKHRIFSASISHSVNGGAPETVDSLFKTYIKKPSEKIMERKPGFVLSAFDDNAGFIALDDNLAVCLKAETHNHPPPLNRTPGQHRAGRRYPRHPGRRQGSQAHRLPGRLLLRRSGHEPADITAPDVIHPWASCAAWCAACATTATAWAFPPSTAPSSLTPRTFTTPSLLRHRRRIPRGDILKEMRPGLKVIVIGGRTGRDGLKEPRSPPPLWMKPPMRKTSPPCKSATRLKKENAGLHSGRA
ncbi:MAG: hypothetical protein ACLSUW_05040 [Akkermansia sp.]